MFLTSARKYTIIKRNKGKIKFQIRENAKIA